jgi:magnesium transporter
MLLHCIAYREGQPIAEPPLEAIHDHLRAPGGFAWVALRDPDPAELARLQEEFGLHELAVEDARHGHQRPKIDEYGDSLFVVLHALEPAPGGALTTGEVHLFVGPGYLVSVKSRTALDLAPVRARCERDPRLLAQGAGFALYAVMDAVVDHYFPLVQALTAELDQVEERILRGASTRGAAEALYAVKQRLLCLHRAVAPLLEATAKLCGGHPPRACAGAEEYFRDVFDHLLRLEGSLENLRDVIGTAMSVNLALVSVQQNDTMRRLAAYAALIAVPTLIAGVFGMNFRHMPELEWTYGYPAALGLMAGLDLWMARRFRRAGWL